jgi:hypothetical protein
MIFWCAVAFGMGFMTLQFGAPIFVSLMPFGMGVLGIILFIAMLTSRPQRQQIDRISYDGYTTYSGDSMGPAYAPVRSEERTLYQVPSRCPSCGASISTEEVDWVGPLQARCPYCSATMDVEKRVF